MTPVKTPYSNALFCKEGCNDLPGTHYRYETGDGPGETGIETVWQLSPDELEIVKQTGRIYLYTVGTSIAPMILSAECLLDVKDPCEGGVTMNE